MAAQTFSEKEMWAAAHRLAAELAQRGIDVNLMKTAAAYTKANPTADFHDWLARLDRLGDLFGSSQNTADYRHELREACRRLEPHPPAAYNWTAVLAWASRLYDFYRSNLKTARRVSDVSNLRLDPKPTPYQPPKSAEPISVMTRKEPEPEDEEPSEAAKDLFAMFQKKWNEEGE